LIVNFFCIVKPSPHDNLRKEENTHINRDPVVEHRTHVLFRLDETVKRKSNDVYHDLIDHYRLVLFPFINHDAHKSVWFDSAIRLVLLSVVLTVKFWEYLRKHFTVS
jgi:hypothetical protein